jgi:hypothetical protein
MMGDYGVELVNDSMQDFYVNFAGPKAGAYTRPLFSST